MQNKEQSVKIITVALVVFICLLLITLLGNVVKLINLKARESDLTARKNALQTQVDENADAIRYLESDDYVERYAREYLNMSGENEEIYVGN